MFTRENIVFLHEYYEMVMGEPLGERELPFIYEEKEIDVGQGNGDF